MSTCVKHWENSNVLFSQLSTRQSLLGRKTTLKIQVKYKVDKVIERLRILNYLTSFCIFVQK